ncbi:MAG: ribonuclease J [Alphaproteobacteria bacterium]|nr:ribonuclease J [Alphaproteobacteria bacterium]
MTALPWKAPPDSLIFVPLGGANEIGMNLNLYAYKGKWLMIDLGIGFADDWLPGVDIVVPDIQFLIEHKEHIVGLVLTHAHEDHIGAVPYLWSELECPIYTTPFTAAVVQEKFASMGLKQRPVIHEIAPGGSTDVGPFGIEIVPITHSIPEMHAVAVKTPKGTVLHTGDWKFDDQPMVGVSTDEKRLKELGDEGVLALVCDSTNVFVQGHSGSEGDVRKSLIELIRTCGARVAVTTFASNVARLESIAVAAIENGRKPALVGRALSRIAAAAQACGYLEGIEFITDKQAAAMPKHEVLFICTGSQGEPRAAIAKISRDEHPVVKLTPGDAVIFSSRVIPGNERKLYRMFNTFVRRGIETITEKDHFVHVSGHPAREELIKMYQLVRPKIAVPVHGEARHLHEHSRLARSLGVEQAVEAHNGAAIRLELGKTEIVGEVKTGYMAVDGLSIIPADGPVMKMRRKIVNDGVVFVSAVLGKHARLEAEAQVTAPGLLDPREDSDLLELVEEAVEDAIHSAKPNTTDDDFRQRITAAVRKVLKPELDKKPVVEVQIIRL